MIRRGIPPGRNAPTRVSGRPLRTGFAAPQLGKAYYFTNKILMGLAE